MKKFKEHFKTILGLDIIVLGIIAIILSSDLFRGGVYEEKNAYGGDAYTGIQNAAATTANNVRALEIQTIKIYQNFMLFVGIAMINSGVIVICYDVCDKNSKKKELPNELNNNII